MDNKDFSNLTNQFKSTVEEALKSANSALEGTLKSEKFNKIKDEIYDKTQGTINEVFKNVKINNTSFKNKKNTETIVKAAPKPPLPIPKIPKGTVAGVLFTVFGSLGTVASSVLLILLSIFNSMLGDFLPINVTFSILGVLLGLNVIMTTRGISLLKRVNRFKGYLKMLKTNGYCYIKDLSTSTDKSPKFIIKDFKKMIALKMFPEGHIDKEQTCLMITNELYNEYLKTEEALRLRKEEELRLKKEEDSITDPRTKELRQTVKDGKKYISQIKEANDALEAEDISNKLDRLESITSKIFSHIEQHPEKLSEIHKFMSYYLPTTLKLVNVYRELDIQPVQGENIINAKKEIKNSLDTINTAFENLLNDLFKDIAFDVSSDISVLKTMLAQEGLTESDFKK